MKTDYPVFHIVDEKRMHMSSTKKDSKWIGTPPSQATLLKNCDTIRTGHLDMTAQTNNIIGLRSGGSEKNRLITGADVRTGDLLPSRMRVDVLSTGQRLRRRRTAGCYSPCVNEALLQVDCVTDRRLVQTLCIRPQMR